jgi:glycosyltransferase involved in cell wall biosynthesis
MRVLLINQVFYPDVAATAQHGHDLARDLARHGHEVTAIASRSIYGKKGASLAPRDVVDGIEIHRVGRSFFGKVGIIGRFADFGLFYIAAMLKAILLPRHDVVVCFTTPPFISAVGRILKMVKGTRFVYWVMDLYPDVAVAAGVLPERGLSTRILERVNRWCLRGADAVVVLGRCMRTRVLAKGIPASAVHLIGVWGDREELQTASSDANAYRDEWNIGDRLLVMYSGNFGIGHEIATFLEAAKSLRDDDRIRFAFVGGGKRKSQVEEFVEASGLEGTCITAEYQPRERLAELLGAADIHLASMLPGWSGVMVPSKLFGILAAARPVIFIGPEDSEVAQVIEELECGSVVTPGDVEAVRRVILDAVEDPEATREAGLRGHAGMVEEHDAVHRLAAWRNLLERVGGTEATS